MLRTSPTGDKFSPKKRIARLDTVTANLMGVVWECAVRLHCWKGIEMSPFIVCRKYLLNDPLQKYL